MKKINLLLGVIFSFATFTVARANAKDILNSGYHHNMSSAPRASFDTLWVDYDVTENDKKGIRIHLKFVTYEMKGMVADIVVFFEDDKGKRLRDNNKKYYSSGGDVALYYEIKSEYDPAYYNDLKLFMPYSELDLTEPGKYDLSMEVKLIDTNGNNIQRLTYYDFEFTKAGTTTNNSSNSPTAKFDSLWVNYGVTENNQLGMRIHVKFNVSKMKGIAAYLAIYFERENGEILKTDNTAYRSKEGQVAIFKSIKPEYDPGYYKDLQLFIPYTALNPGPGKSDLNMDVDIIYEKGDLIKHLNYHGFWINY